MPDDTGTVDVQTSAAPAIVATAAVNDVITLDEAKQRESRVAAAARKAAEAEWQGKLDEALKPLTERLSQYEAAEQAAKDAELSELERERKAREDLEKQLQSYSEQTKSLASELEGNKRRSQVSLMIASSAERVPSRYHGEVYASLANADAVTQESVDEALKAARAQWEADVSAYLPPQAPQPRSIGSPTTPPAAPTRSAPQMAEDRQAAVADLVARYQNGDADAGRQLDLLYGTPNPNYRTEG